MSVYTKKTRLQVGLLVGALSIFFILQAHAGPLADAALNVDLGREQIAGGIKAVNSFPLIRIEKAIYKAWSDNRNHDVTGVIKRWLEEQSGDGHIVRYNPGGKKGGWLNETFGDPALWIRKVLWIYYSVLKDVEAYNVGGEIKYRPVYGTDPRRGVTDQGWGKDWYPEVRAVGASHVAVDEWGDGNLHLEVDPGIRAAVRSKLEQKLTSYPKDPIKVKMFEGFYVSAAEGGKYSNWNGINVLPEVGRGVLKFMAVAHNDIHIALRGPKGIYEFVLGGWGNSRSVLRRGSQGPEIAAVQGPGVLPGALSEYWVMVDYATGYVGCGFGNQPGQKEIIAYKDESFFDVREFAFSSWNTPVQYRSAPVNVVPKDSWHLQQLPAGTKVTIKSQHWDKYLRVEDGKYLRATGTDRKDPACQFEVVRFESWISLKSAVAGNNILQSAAPGDSEQFSVRFENPNFHHPDHTWEHWALVPVDANVKDLDVRFQNQITGGFLCAPDPVAPWTKGRLWTCWTQTENGPERAGAGGWERFKVEPINPF
ncbi:hypothetical protein FJ364_05260, partial [Candidatus Dependentiae bacterium]|nr:hypothetical protein [Candidatus Dependentiae bacterium]